jgi:hypothetical protein
MRGVDTGNSTSVLIRAEEHLKHVVDPTKNGILRQSTVRQIGDCDGIVVRLLSILYSAGSTSSLGRERRLSIIEFGNKVKYIISREH